MPIGGGFGGGSSDLDVTGSIPTSVSRVNASVGAPSEADLAYARAAASEVLAKGGKGRQPPVGEPEHGRTRFGHAP